MRRSITALTPVLTVLTVSVCAQAAQNLGMEGGFTSGVPNNWTKYTLSGSVTVSQDTANAFDGSNSVNVNPGGNGANEGGVWQQLPVTNGTTYTITVHVKGGAGYLDIDRFGGAGNH